MTETSILENSSTHSHSIETVKLTVNERRSTVRCENKTRLATRNYQVNMLAAI